MSKPARTLNRRDAMKILAGVVGAAALASVRSQWETPLVQIGALPAHAQCSAIRSNYARFILTNDTTSVYSFSYSSANSNGSITLDPGETGSIDIPVGVILDIEETACGNTNTGIGVADPDSAGGCFNVTVVCNNNLMLQQVIE